MVNGWSGISGMVSNTSKNGFHVFDAILFAPFHSIIVSRPALSSLHCDVGWTCMGISNSYYNTSAVDEAYTIRITLGLVESALMRRQV